MGTQILGPIPVQLALAVDPRLHPFKAAALFRRVEPGWQTRAACVGAKDPDAWFPHDHTPEADLAEPLAVCASCPVRRSCLAAGLLGAEHGLWGGVVESRRRDALADLSGGALVDDVLDTLLDYSERPAAPARQTTPTQTGKDAA